ncbi:MAG: hypothetical protein HY955_01685 [Deltaproteobacteria bacterium]|nr:hypothetical protein [Deltaproteobacteria bacterium]OGP25396.1 MAG: hypothetical protein A2X99_09870 [Deltaproteobacteria bacterium GWB2_55_19]OGP33524.1 MAG: hypothetical protein A2X93_06635 [Deltaproteobacteria bacterium GWC2_56_8]
MSTFEMVLTYGGIAYGVMLIYTSFVKNRVTEAFRLDTLFIPGATERSRPLNLFAGIAVIGYNIYAMLY